MARSSSAEQKLNVNAMDRAEMREASRRAHEEIEARDGRPPKSSKSVTSDELRARVQSANLGVRSGE